jgi:hypothetical protein
VAYRFFPAFSAKYARASILQQGHVVATGAPPTLRPTRHSPGLRFLAPRRHAGIAAHCSRGRMLLPLHGIAPARRLREVVRFETICLALVGHQMRETPHADTEERFTRRPEIPASGPCRTRQTLSLAPAALVLERHSVARRQPDTPKQVLEARVRAQIVQVRIHIQVEHPLVSGGKSLL